MPVPCKKICEKTVEIVNVKGLHARAAAKFVQTVEKRRAAVTVFKDDMVVGGLSIMGLLMLAAGRHAHIRIAAEGDDAEETLDDLVRLVASGFGEES